MEKRVSRTHSPSLHPSSQAHHHQTTYERTRHARGGGGDGGGERQAAAALVGGGGEKNDRPFSFLSLCSSFPTTTREERKHNFLAPLLYVLRLFGPCVCVQRARRAAEGKTEGEGEKTGTSAFYCSLVATYQGTPRFPCAPTSRKSFCQRAKERKEEEKQG